MSQPASPQAGRTNAVLDFGMGRLDAAIKWAKDQPKWFVYAICWSDGKPVYIGSTSQPEKRQANHATMYGPAVSDWMRINPAHRFEILDTFPTKRMMLDAEHEYIAYLKPRFNPGRWPYAATR